MGKALGEGAEAAAANDADERDAEDVVNAALEARMPARFGDDLAHATSAQGQGDAHRIATGQLERLQ